MIEGIRVVEKETGTERESEQKKRGGSRINILKGEVHRSRGAVGLK